MNINNKNTEILLITKSRNKCNIQNRLNYEMGSLDLNNNENKRYIDEITKMIKEIANDKLKNIYFNLQNEEIIIRTIENLKTKRPKEIVKLIQYEIGDYMSLNLQSYVIKYKKIINTKGNQSVQGILFPKKYVDICKLISQNLKIKKKYLHINFDILQKLIDLKLIDLSQMDDSKVTIIENRDKDIIINTIFNKKIIESYVIDKDNNQYTINQFKGDLNTYYYGISDDFINNLELKKINIKNKLILNDSDGIVNVTIDYLSSYGMII